MASSASHPATTFADEHDVDLRIDGPDEVFPSAYRVTELAAQAIGAATAAVAAFDRLRTGRDQAVTVDRLHAGIAFRSERHLRLDGRTPASPWGPIAGTYRTADGGWVQIHANFPHHEAGALAVLGLADPDRDAVKAAVATWDAQELEDALAASGMCASRQRSTEEWLAHPQGRGLDALGPLDVEQIGSADPEVPEPTDDRPLSGVRVLDLTRVIAGPVAGRFLAAHGADVLKVDGPHLPQIDLLVVDTGPGKRSCLLDLRVDADRDRLLALVRDADVLVDGYRPGSLGQLGLSADELLAARPGLVVVDLSAYGPVGPWAGRRGFDSLVQTASGVTHAGQQAFGTERPHPLPCQALDQGTGYLLAFGVVDALRRRATEGGSWRVRGSLARTRHWLERLGRIDATDLPEPEVPAGLLLDLDTPTGSVTLVRPPGSLSATPPAWRTPPVSLGHDDPTW
jgi:crotonobetainyl-CoA:carnitine CoA-transferase CaiB-like acyl-CoA transferase